MRRLLIILSVTVDAPAHFELGDRHQISDMRVVDDMKLVDRFYLTVTGLAFHTRLDMAVMSELDVLREAMKLDPFADYFS